MVFKKKNIAALDGGHFYNLKKEGGRGAELELEFGKKSIYGQFWGNGGMGREEIGRMFV